MLHLGDHPPRQKWLLRIGKFQGYLDVIEEGFRCFAFSIRRKHVGRENLEGRATRLGAIFLLKGEELICENDLDVVNVLKGDGGGPNLAALGDGLVLFVNFAAKHLHVVVVTRDLLLIQHLVVHVFKRVERAVQ